MIAFSFGRGAHEEAARGRREGLDVHLVTVADLMDRPDDGLVRIGVTTASGLLPGLEATPCLRLTVPDIRQMSWCGARRRSPRTQRPTVALSRACGLWRARPSKVVRAHSHELAHCHQ